MKALKRTSRITIMGLVLGACLLAIPGFASEKEQEQRTKRIAESPHNLTGWIPEVGSGTQDVERNICRSCHPPALVEELTPLWDRNLPRGPYERGLLLEHAEQGQPADSTSRACLACHDGHLAPGFPGSGIREMAGSPLSVGDLGELEAAPLHTHLFDWPMDENSSMPLVDRSLVDLPLPGERIGCASCHDPHDNSEGNFLREPAASGEICVHCHQTEEWAYSVHGANLWTEEASLEEQGCASCHSLHGRPARHDLLIAEEFELCMHCHDGIRNTEGEVPADQDLQHALEKPYGHRFGVLESSRDQEADREGFLGFLAGSRQERSLRCSDCHNVHAASEHDQLGTLDGSLLGASGVDRLGMAKARAEFEYEICLKCHGFSSLAPPWQRDVSADFDLANASFHPVMGVGNGVEVPSLLEGWSTISTMTCSDCHGNDNPEGPQGPHASNLEHMLKAPWTDSPYSLGGTDENGLCFTCHRESWFTSGQGWRWHKLHIERGGYSCAACHDPHGSPDQPGLLRLDVDWIEAVDGEKRIERVSLDEGTCTIKCHGYSHRNSPY